MKLSVYHWLLPWDRLPEAELLQLKSMSFFKIFDQEERFLEKAHIAKSLFCTLYGKFQISIIRNRYNTPHVLTTQCQYLPISAILALLPLLTSPHLKLFFIGFVLLR